MAAETVARSPSKAAARNASIAFLSARAPNERRRSSRASPFGGPRASRRRMSSSARATASEANRRSRPAAPSRGSRSSAVSASSLR